MAYSAASDVKLTHRLNLSVTTWDTAIADCIEAADKWIDARLDAYDANPDSTTLKHISADYAAYLYLSGVQEQKGGETSKAGQLRARAEDMLERWIKANRREFIRVVNG